MFLAKNSTVIIFISSYSISVGIERLEKIAYLLTAHKYGDENPTTKWKKHDHPKLYQLINQHIELSYSERELAFLNVLKDFYVDGRYQRFNYNEDSLTPNKDKNLLLTFYVGITILSLRTLLVVKKQYS